MKYQNIPMGYSLCSRNDCPKATTCTRNIVYNNLSPEVEHITILNPHIITPTTDGCPHFRPFHIVRNAYGFTNMLKRIPKGNGELLFFDIPAASSERDYYRLRRGDKPIPPSVQEQIISAVTQRGALPPLEFDKYIEEVEW